MEDEDLIPLDISPCKRCGHKRHYHIDNSSECTELVKLYQHISGKWVSKDCNCLRFLGEPKTIPLPITLETPADKQV